LDTRQRTPPGIGGMIETARLRLRRPVLEDKATDSPLGQVGFQRFVRGIDASREALPEAGWVLASGVHGRGFGREAVAAVLAWGDEHLDAARTVAIIDPENTPSLRVAAEFGYREIRRVDYLMNPIVVFERPRGGNWPGVQ
jgi:RimJ/RimL family protein N-acetyltransferase